MNPELKLRDIHLPPEPSWWPPAPGWWVLALLILLVMVLLTRWVLRRIREQRRLALLVAEFDAAVANGEPTARLAAISQLLRRAVRLRDPHAAQLQGEAWLHFLDDADGVAETRSSLGKSAAFSAGIGRLLLDGPYQARVDAGSVEALIEPARRRFVSLVAAP